MRLHAIQSCYCFEAGISYTCLSLMDRIHEGVERRYWAYNFAPEARREYSSDAIAPLTFRLLSRFRGSSGLLQRMLEQRVARNIQPGDVAWVWPPGTSRFYYQLRAAGAVIVTERVNTCVRLFRRSVMRAYEHLDWRPPHDWRDDDADMRNETAMVRNSDAVFAPNRFVRESLLEIGYPTERILDTSYGWCPLRMQGTGASPLPPQRRLRFLFVGTGSVRKGLPQLLRAWKDAAVDAELLIAGLVDKDVARGCAELLARPDVIQLGFVRNIADIYRSADVFVFPTHEEGGPQVTFEAAACGLALLVSPMGSAGAFRAEVDALIADPFDHAGWVDRVRALATDSGLLARLKSAARARAQDYTWEKVGLQRLALLRQLSGESA